MRMIMKGFMVLFAVLSCGCAFADRDPFIPPADGELSAEVLELIALLQDRVVRTEENMRDLEAYVIEMQASGSGNVDVSSQPVLVGQSSLAEYYRLPDGSVFVYEKGSEERRPGPKRVAIPPREAVEGNGGVSGTSGQDN